MTEANTDGFARTLVPVEAQGPGRQLFFIVAGTMCGLPVLLLASQIVTALGLGWGIAAFLCGGLASGILGGLSALSGSRTRMNVSLLSERSFGTWGASVVKLAIALAMVGWFGVIVSVLGAVVSATFTTLTGWNVPPVAIAVVLAALVAAATLRGVSGMERLGQVLLPLIGLILAYAIVRTAPELAKVDVIAQGGLSFGQAVSAVIGGYIVGIIIQPDYGRFIRRPLGAGLASVAALALAYPAILALSAIPPAALGKPDLIAAAIQLGIGVPALLLLVLGAWLDATGCLYSGSLSLTNQFPRFRFKWVVVGATLFGMLLALLGAEAYFLPFLAILGTALPPVAVVQIAEALTRPANAITTTTLEGEVLPRIRVLSCAAWAGGAFTGFLGTYAGFSLTGITSLDSIVVAAAILLVGKLVQAQLRKGPGKGAGVAAVAAD